MKDFNNSYIQDPIIEDVSSSNSSGKMFKFSSGYAVYVGNYTTQSSSFTKQGNIALSGDEHISLTNLGFKTILGGSVAKNGFQINNAIFGSFFSQSDIRMTLFRGDNSMYSGVEISVIVFGLWK